MSQQTDKLFYTAEHAWVAQGEDGVYTVGITDFAQNALGDVVFVQLPNLGVVSAGEAVCLIESVKSASDVYSPLAGEIIWRNEKLEHSPELINQDPYGEGQLFRLKIQSADDLANLLTFEDYQKIIT